MAGERTAHRFAPLVTLARCPVSSWELATSLRRFFGSKAPSSTARVFSFDGYANFTQDNAFKRMVSADASSISAMIATYLDLPELGVPRLGPFSPFVGGGIGVSHIRIDETRMGHPDARTTTIVPAGDRVNFAWMLTTGIATPVGERAILDFSWRYTDTGTVETGQDNLRIAYRDGRPTRVFDFDLEKTRANLRSHGLHVSVRYAF